MCYRVDQYVSAAGERPIARFVLEEVSDDDTREWVLEAISQLGNNKGMLNNGALETKHIRDKNLN